MKDMVTGTPKKNGNMFLFDDMFLMICIDVLPRYLIFTASQLFYHFGVFLYDMLKPTKRDIRDDPRNAKRTARFCDPWDDPSFFSANESPAKTWLVFWNIWIMFFHSVGNFIIPTDELIFFRGVETTNQKLNNLLFLFAPYIPMDPNGIYAMFILGTLGKPKEQTSSPQ